MNVKITKPDSTLYDGEAKLVQLPGTSGLFEILNNHAPIISSLAKGTLEKRYPTPGGSGTPFILDNTLFCTSPKRLLYAFPLSK